MEKKMKPLFRPFKIPRYLPGQVKRSVLVGDLKTYNEHRYNIYNSKSNIDHHPLPMKLQKCLNSQRLVNDATRLIEIDKNNKELIKKINRINRTGGMVDTYNPIAYAYKSRWRKQELHMKTIVRHNKEFYKKISKAESCYSCAELEEFWKHVLQKFHYSCKFPIVFLPQKTLDQMIREQQSISAHLEVKADEPDRPKCFMDFRVREGVYLGRIVIELYHDYVPVTVENFMSICCGKNNLTYKQCYVHRVAPGQYLATGDITLGNGKGGNSIYGKYFPEENHTLKHTKMGVLSATRVGNMETNSQFSITLTSMEKLDDQNVVFGQVIIGNKTLCKINDLGRKFGRPSAPILVCNCGKYIEGQTPAAIKIFRY